MQDDQTQKSFEPTEQKLLQARKKGDIAKSQDILTTSVYVGVLIAVAIVSGGWIADSVNGLAYVIAKPETFVGTGGVKFEADLILRSMLVSQSPFMLVLVLPMFFVLLSALAQRSIVFAPTKLQPKLSRISPISIAKQKYGASGLFEWFKSFVKLVLFSIVITVIFLQDLEKLMVSSSVDARISVSAMDDYILKVLAYVCLLSGAIAVVDYFFQYFEHRRKLMMSRKEITDESKENEGDPHMKQERLQRARARASEQSVSSVETADVVITNPTHYAVALQWSREAGSAPTCVCKGVDHIALAIRERAREFDVPIHEDPPTARALFAGVDVGDEVAPELYEAVAAAIRFSDEMRQRAAGRLHT